MSKRPAFVVLWILVASAGLLLGCGDESDFDGDGEDWDSWEEDQAIAASSSLRVLSWNLRHEGWSGETNYAADAAQIWNQFGASASSPNGCDLVFLQEVMYPEAAEGIAEELEALSGVTWVAEVTPVIGRSTYKEAYAVLYRTDRADVEDWWIWNDVGDKFEREPMIVKVRDVRSGADYTFINWHTIFGSTTERKAEVTQISKVFGSVQAAESTDQDVILLGDHNAPATSSWWTPFTSLIPTVGWKINDPTTLNSSGAYASAYDHFWFQASYLTEFSSAGRDYVANTQNFVTNLSDHVPIWMKLYSTADTD
ncbi:MAG: deoxyribonuclease I [Deltaproteobacteria bacterium]|nr:deoxyribonuclease I [Deltaproteobacteria bacterium]